MKDYVKKRHEIYREHQDNFAPENCRTYPDCFFLKAVYEKPNPVFFECAHINMPKQIFSNTFSIFS